MTSKNEVMLRRESYEKKVLMMSSKRSRLLSLYIIMSFAVSIIVVVLITRSTVTNVQIQYLFGLTGSLSAWLGVQLSIVLFAGKHFNVKIIAYNMGVIILGTGFYASSIHDESWQYLMWLGWLIVISIFYIGFFEFQSRKSQWFYDEEHRKREFSGRRK